MGSPLHPYLIPVWETVIVVAQVGACVAFWWLLRRQNRIRRDAEFRLQLLLKTLKAERKATHAARALWRRPAASDERRDRTLH